ncbi:MAG: radical SAM/Cys-rich domain protein [Firmicutes bacterium]|nr:radical SAM/Cys-rich domain protein [Bacillota bacterium]
MRSFYENIQVAGKKLVRNNIDTVQINVGYVCNLKCRHCHVQAGPERTEQMSVETIEACLKFITKAKASTVDITGGSPELNPHLSMLIEGARKIPMVNRIIVRTNLTMLADNSYKHLIDFFKVNNVQLVASMPCYGEENVNAQRGTGVFKHNIEALKLLNCHGYGKAGTGLTLDLVYNPGGAFLPGPQAQLQAAYKEQLKDNYGIEFNKLFTITNAPCGRFKEALATSGELEAYMELLVNSYNQDNLEKVMCLSQVNIGWDGTVYDCDFNQVQKMKIKVPKTIIDLTPEDVMGEILVDEHCYCCTAGAGSSCQGSLG